MLKKFELISGKTPATLSTSFTKLKTKKMTGEILEDAISFAKPLFHIDDIKIRTIKHFRKSIVFHKNVAWKKRKYGKFI